MNDFNHWWKASGSPETNFPRFSDTLTWSSRTKKSSLSTLSSIFSSPKLHPWDPKMEWNQSNKFQAAPRWQQRQQIQFAFCFSGEPTGYTWDFKPSDRHQRLQGVESWALPAMPLILSTFPPNKIPKRTLVFWICENKRGAIFGGIGYEGDGSTMQESRQATCACKHRCNFPIPRLTTSRNDIWPVVCRASSFSGL